EMHAEQLTWVQVVPDVPEVGYGLGIVNDFGWLGHDGTVFGYDTVMLYRPDLDLSLVTLANSDIPTEELMWPAHSVAAGIMSIINREYPSEVDRKSTRLNSSHVKISYAVFCLKKKI